MKTSTSFLATLLFTGAVFFFSSCKDKNDPDGVDPGPIQLDCDHFKTAQTLTDDPERAVDYYVNCVMDVEAAIVVGAGVVIEFAQDAGINVTETGSFNASGTAASRISFTGENKDVGSWKGILFNSNDTNNRLQYVNISHAGGAAFNTNNDIASVIIWADTKLEIDHCTISEGGNYGVSAIYTNSNWNISESTISSCNNAPAIFLAPYLASFDGSNEFAGNANDYLLIDLATQSITSDLAWKKSSVPYQVTSTFSFFNELTIDNSTVTMEPGVSVAFEDGTGMMVEDDATLIANGTSSEPINFTGVTETAGSWTSIYFNANASTNNAISNATISYAGAELDGENSGVLMRVNPVLSLENIIFNDIAGCSVFNKDVALNPNLNSSNLTHNNTLGTLCHE